jgi:putative flippase GtrA
VNIVGWAINTGILLLLRSPFTNLLVDIGSSLTIISNPELSYKLGYNLAKAVATVVVMFWNFGINRIWTYSDAP